MHWRDVKLLSFDKKDSFVFFTYFASFAVIVPLSGLYLNNSGFDTKQIGIILGIATSTRVLGPYIFLFLAKIRKDLIGVGTIQCILLLVATILGGLFNNNVIAILALCLTNILWVSILPNLETVSLSYLKGDINRYSTIRMWGSIGFIFVSLWASYVIINFGSKFFWYILIVLSVLQIVSVSSLKNFGPFPVKENQRKIFRLERGLLGYYLVFFLFEMSHAPYNNFFSISLVEHGYSGLYVGSLIAFSVVCEIVTFAKGSVLLKYFDVNRILIFCAITAAIRWLLLEYYISNLFLLTFSQLLHSFTFALYHICAMHVLSRNATQDVLGLRQTTYTVFTMGIAAAIGSYLSGILWHNVLLNVSSFITVGVFSAIISLLLVIFIMISERKHKNTLNYYKIN